MNLYRDCTCQSDIHWIFPWSKEASICHLATVCCQSQTYRVYVSQKVQASVSVCVCVCACFKIFCPYVLWLRDQTVISTHRVLLLLSVILPWHQQEHQVLESIRKDLTRVEVGVGFWENGTTYNSTMFSLQDKSTIEIARKAPALAMHLISNLSTYKFV